MNWLESLLNGCLAKSCSNVLDWNLVIGLRDECVESSKAPLPLKSSRWLKVMNILELVAKVVRKVRGKNAVDSDSGDDPVW